MAGPRPAKRRKTVSFVEHRPGAVIDGDNDDDDVETPKSRSRDDEPRTVPYLAKGADPETKALDCGNNVIYLGPTLPLVYLVNVVSRCRLGCVPDTTSLVRYVAEMGASQNEKQFPAAAFAVTNPMFPKPIAHGRIFGTSRRPRPDAVARGSRTSAPPEGISMSQGICTINGALTPNHALLVSLSTALILNHRKIPAIVNYFNVNNIVATMALGFFCDPLQLRKNLGPIVRYNPFRILNASIENKELDLVILVYPSTGKIVLAKGTRQAQIAEGAKWIYYQCARVMTESHRVTSVELRKAFKQHIQSEDAVKSSFRSFMAQEESAPVALTIDDLLSARAN